MKKLLITLLILSGCGSLQVKEAEPMTEGHSMTMRFICRDDGRWFSFQIDCDSEFYKGRFYRAYKGRARYAEYAEEDIDLLARTPAEIKDDERVAQAFEDKYPGILIEVDE